MSVSAAQAEAFYDEALRNGEVWGIKDGGGFPAPQTPEGRAMPFWSLASRASTIIDGVAAYAGFEPVAISLEDWRARWLPGLAKDGVRVGLNWSGPTASGFDLPPEDVERNLAARNSG